MPEKLLESILVGSLNQRRQGRIYRVGLTQSVSNNDDVEFVSIGKERQFIARRDME